MATTSFMLICPQGHGAAGPGSKFCTICGTQLTAGSDAAEPSASLPTGVTVLAAETPAFTPLTTPTAVTETSFSPVNTSVASAPTPSLTTPPSTLQPFVDQAKNFFSAPAAMIRPAAACTACGGTGAGLDASENVCARCGWLRPLLPGYQLERSVFVWKQDGQAMSKLEKISALHAVVKAVSDKVGRPWIESTFNGIRLGPKQLPEVWKQAVLAARIMGLPKMPDVYVAGDKMWDSYTFGTDTSSFVVLGTAILTNFQGEELLFLLAREMGHCRAGHALWKTVTRFLAGDVSVHSGLLSNGLLNALSISKIVEGAVDIPLMAWARQSEITADRAGLLAIGDEELARKVLLAWSIRSSRLLKQINIDEWMKQEVASDDAVTRFSEMTTSSSMYTTRRLRLMGQAAQEPALMRWSQSVQPVRKALVEAQKPEIKAQGTLPGRTAGEEKKPSDALRVICTKCKTAMRVPFTVLAGKTSLNVRCPKCEFVMTLRSKGKAAEKPVASAGAAIPAAAQAGVGTTSEAN